MSAPPKVYIKSFGCQMNVYDAHRIADVLARHGYAETATPEGADLIVLNTCHIRDKAVEKVYSELGRVRRTKQQAEQRGRRVAVVVAGCVAQAEGQEISRRAPVVDIVVGPQSYHRLPALLARSEAGRAVVDTEFPVDSKFDHIPPAAPETIRRRGVSAFVTVQEGCDKFCTFCVVPYTRGPECSRPVRSVVAEVERLAAAGVREAVLIGQNVSAYHGEGPDGRDWSLGRLLQRLADVEGIVRLRYTTSHPRDVDASLVAAHRNLPQLMPYLHLPVQSGSDRLLAAMKRRHRRADYLGGIARLRAARPDLAFSSDFIVGFPGETESDFAETLALVEEVGYANAYSFKFSPRPGTPAAEMSGQVPEAVKEDRLARLQAAIKRQAAIFNARWLHATVEVLLEREGRHPGELVGRSPYHQPVRMAAPVSRIGEIVPATITEIGCNGLLARLAEPIRQTRGAGPALATGA